jgi:hypothetical protein
MTHLSFFRFFFLKIYIHEDVPKPQNLDFFMYVKKSAFLEVLFFGKLIIRATKKKLLFLPRIMLTQSADPNSSQIII